MLSPSFFIDDELVQHFDFCGRIFYEGLWCLAEDSGIYEPKVLALKMQIFPGDNVPLEMLENYLEKLINLGKVIVYEANGKKMHWLKNFHKHQKVDKPSPPMLPLPPWIKWHGEEEMGTKRHLWYYEVRNDNGQFGDNSGTSSGNGDDQSPLEEKRSKVKLSKEKLSEGKGCGGTNEPGEAQNNRPLNNHLDTEIKNTTQGEREILSVLKSIELYPFEHEKDLAFIRDLATDYPDLDLLYQVKKWRDYKRDKPLTKKSSPRAQIRNWMNKASEWKEENNHGKIGGSTAGGAARADPAGKYREFVRSSRGSPGMS